MIGLLVTAVAMALLSTKSQLPLMWGAFFLTGILGLFFTYAMMFISDWIDDRRMDDRKLSSRFFNGIGLLIIAGTALVLLGLGAYALFMTGLALLSE